MRLELAIRNSSLKNLQVIHNQHLQTSLISVSVVSIVVSELWPAYENA